MYLDYGVWTSKYVNVSTVAMDTNGNQQILGAQSEQIDTFGGTKSGHIDTIRGSQSGHIDTFLEPAAWGFEIQNHFLNLK